MIYAYQNGPYVALFDGSTGTIALNGKVVSVISRGETQIQIKNLKQALPLGIQLSIMEWLQSL